MSVKQDVEFDLEAAVARVRNAFMKHEGFKVGDVWGEVEMIDPGDRDQLSESCPYRASVKLVVDVLDKDDLEILHDIGTRMAVDDVVVSTTDAERLEVEFVAYVTKVVSE